MNTLVATHRQTFPNDPRSDADILSDYVATNPEEVAKIPDALADWNRIQQQAAASTPDNSEPTTTAPAAFVGSAVRNVAPTAAFMAAAAPGAKAGALIGAAIPGLGETGISEVVGGAIGAVITGSIAAWGAHTAQRKIADAVAPDSVFGSASEDVQSAEHPIASELGGLIVMGKPNPMKVAQAAKTLASKAGMDALKLIAKEGVAALDSNPKLQAETLNVVHVAMGGGMNAAMNAYDQIKSGNFSAKDLLKSAAEGMLFNEPWIHAPNPKVTSSSAGDAPEPESAAGPIIRPMPEQEINPAAQYDFPTADRKAEIQSVVQRELAGDKGHEVNGAINNIYANSQSNPYDFRFYQEEKARQVADAQAQSASPTPAPVDVVTPPTPPTVAAMAPPSGVYPNVRVSQAEIAPDAATGRLDAARRAATNISTSRESPVSPDLRSKRLEALASKPPQELTQEDFIALRTKQLAERGRAMPPGQLAALHEKLVAEAVKNGLTVPANVLKDYPTISAAVTGTSPDATASSQAATVEAKPSPNIASPAVSTEAKKPMPTAADQSSSDMAQGRTPPMPTINSTQTDSKSIVDPWTRAPQGNADDLVNRAAFEKSKVTTSEGGKGKKSATAYTEAADPEELYKDSSSDKNDRNSSRKLGVFQSPDGSHVVVGTAYENGKGEAARKVTFFNSDGMKQSVQFKKLLAQGYKLIASIKTTDPTKGYVVTYSPHEWEKAQTELRAKSAEGKQGGVAPVPEAQAKEIIGGGEEQQGASVVSTPNAPVEEWSKGGGKIEPALVDKLMTSIGEPKWTNSDEGREQIINGLGEMPVEDSMAVLKAISPVDRRSGQQDLMAGAEILQEKIYEAFEKGKTAQEVARELTGLQGGSPKSGGESGNPSVAGQTATRPITPEPERAVSRPNAAGLPASEGKGSRTLGDTTGPANDQVRFSERPNAPGAASTTQLKSQWDSVLETAAENGIRLTVLQGLHEGGEWQRRAVTLTVADAAKPTADNVTLAIHELAGHPVFDSLTDAQKQMMYRAFEKVGMPEGVGVKVPDGAHPAQVAAEETLVERAARNLQAEGFNPKEAGGIAQQVIRLLKGLYLKASIAIQAGLLGVDHVSPELAQEYFENRMRQYLAGDSSPMSFISFMGGAKPSVEQRGDTFKPVGGDGATSSVDLVNGRMGYREVLPETMAALTHNSDIALADRRFSERNPDLATVHTFDPHVVSRDLNSTSKVEEDIAAYNALHDMHAALFKVFDKLNPGKQTFEQFLSNFTNADGPAMEKVALRNADLVANGLPEADPTFRPHELTSEASRMQASDKAYRYGWSLREWMSQKRVEAERFLKTATDRLARKNTQLAQLTSDYTNADLIFNQAKERTGELIKTLGQSAKHLGNNGYKLGTLEQVIKNLDGTISRPLLAQYEKVMNQLYRTLSTNPAEAMKFTDMLERVSQLKVDWDNDSPTDIKDAIKLIAKGDPLLEPFVQGTMESRSLLAMAVAFGKSDSHVMDFLNMRRSTAVEERQVINKALDIAMRDHADAITEARKLVSKLPRLGKVADHLLQKLQQLKDENHALIDENQRNRTFIDFHSQAYPALQAQVTQLEHVLGARSPSWEANDKAEYLVAPKPNATGDEVAANKAVFKLTGIEDNQIVKQHIAQNNEWLNAQPADQRGALWNTVKEMTTKLENAVGVATHELVIKKSFVNNYLGSIIDKLESTGLPALRVAAQRFRRYRAEQFASNSDADTKGTVWAGAESRAMKSLGFETAGMNTFEQLFYQAAHSFAEKNPDHWASFKDAKSAFEAFLPKLKDYFVRSADQDIRERMQRPGAWTALEAFYRADYAASDSVNAFRSKLGLKIREMMPDGSTIEREPIGSNFGTALRRVRQSTSRMYHKMRDIGWLGTKQDKAFDPAAVADEYNNDPAALDDRLQQYLSPDIEREFIRPLVHGMEGRSAFYAPVGEDGITKVALSENVKKAYEASQGSLVSFAKNLFDLETADHGSLESEAEFVGKTVGQFKEFFDALHNQFKDNDDAVRHGMATPPRIFQDARVSEAWPGAWLEYHTYGRYDMHALYNHLTSQAAFGRNLDGMRADLQTGIKSLSEKVGSFSDISEHVQNENRTVTGRKLDALIKAEVERRGLNYTDLKQASRNLTMVRSEQRNFESLMNLHGGLALELRPFMELVSAAAGATVQGPVTALLHIPNLYAQFSKLGIGPASLGVMTRSMSSTASEMLGTLTQLFHAQIGWNADRNARRVRNGIVDTDAMRSFQDARAGLLNDPTIASNPATRVLFTFARSIRLATSTGFGKAAQGAENAYATFKPHALFSQTANHIDAGLIDGWTQGFEDHIERAIEYFSDPAHAGDRTDPSFRFTNLEQLGYSKGFLGIGGDDRAFKFFTNALARYGIDLEGHAREVMNQRATDSTFPALNDEQFRRIASLVQNEVTLESSIATRPSAFFTNPILRMGAPLLGWSVAKSHDAWESWRNPDLTQTSANPMRRLAIGALPYLALVPAGVAMGALRNMMQTSLTGKRANREDPTSFAGALDSLAWVGTFGLGGDVTNSLVNRDTQRPFDVDHRVFFVSSMHSAISAMQNWYEQGSADYSTVYRPLMQALGGNGALQYLDIANHALSLDNAEARVTARINVGNYLRVAGRELKLDVRVNDGGEVISNPLRPLIGQMVMASFANDAQGFQQAYHQAIDIATTDKGNRSEAMDAVQRAFEARNPLRSVFRTPPTTQDVARILSSLPPEGKDSVSSALRLFNSYGAQVINSKGAGLKPEMGREPKMATPYLSPERLNDIRSRAMAM